MRIAVQKQVDAFYPYQQEDIDATEKLKDNGFYFVTGKASVDALRTLAQNRLQFKWFRDLERQGDQTAPEYRAYCKLQFGVPILRSEDEEFREIYDRIIRPLPYEDKLTLMTEPIDLPVTSHMSVDLMLKYLKTMSDYYLEKGFQLTKLEHLSEMLKEYDEKGPP